MRVRRSIVIGLTVVLAACGGGADPDEGDTSGEDGATGDDVGTASDTGGAVSENAMATLVVAGESYTFEANEWSRCELGSQETDVEAYFGDGEEIPAGTSDYDFVNFNVVVDKIFIRGRVAGEEVSHTATVGDNPINVTGNGFSYSDPDGNGISIEVTC